MYYEQNCHIFPTMIVRLLQNHPLGGRSDVSFVQPSSCQHVRTMNKSANALALCHLPSANFCSVLEGQWSSRIFTHDRYNILSDILIEFEVNLGIIIEKYAKT